MPDHKTPGPIGRDPVANEPVGPAPPGFHSSEYLRPGPIGTEPAANGPVGGAPPGVQSSEALGGIASYAAGPQLLFQGKEAIETIARILPKAAPITVNAGAMGSVELKPGAIWSGHKMLVYAETMTVYYAVDDRLYEYSTSKFVLSEWLNAMGEGARRAEGMVWLAKVEMALLVGIFVPIWVILVADAVVVSLWYLANKQKVNTFVAKVPRIIELVADFRRNHTALFNKILITSGMDLLKQLPNGVTGEDIAFFLGRVLKGGKELPELSFGALAKMTAKVAAIVGSLHLPSITAEAIKLVAEQNAEKFARDLEADGIHLTKEEARTILEFMLSRQAGNVAEMKELSNACREFVPILEDLQKSWH